MLGLDIGTSAVKGVVVGDDGDILAAASAPLESSRPKPQWSEQDPEDWWHAAIAITRELRSADPNAWRAIGAIGLSGQMHGTVLLDADRRIIRPAILWNDGRAVAEARLIEDIVGNAGLIAGVKPMPGFAARKSCGSSVMSRNPSAASPVSFFPRTMSASS